VSPGSLRTITIWCCRGSKTTTTILRISRNAAYAAAREWRATGGKVGIPCIEIGRTLRVPAPDSNGSSAAPLGRLGPPPLGTTG